MNRTSFLFALFLALPAAIHAQPKLRVPAQPTCAGCTVESRKLFTVGPIPGANVGRDSHVARDSSGRYLVVVEPGPRVAVVDSMGTFVEFLELKSSRKDSSARHAFIRVDSDKRPSLFDGEAWITEHALISEKLRVGLIDGYRVVAQAPVMGLPIATSRPASVPHRTFGTMKIRMDPLDVDMKEFPDDHMRPAKEREQFEIDSVVSNPACRDCADLVVEVPHGFAKGAVWTATVDRYRINIYESFGKLLVLAIEVTDGWLPSGASASFAAGRTLPETPRMTGLSFDARNCKDEGGGRLKFADPRRSTACERHLWVAGLTMADSTAREERQRYTTVVEVLGVTGTYLPRLGTPLDSARVITRTQMPGRVELFGPGLAYQHRALANGQWALDVFRLSVAGR